MKPIHLIPFIGILALVGCSHQQPQKPKTLEYFSTQIKPDDAKQFSYTLTVEMPEQKDSGGRGHGGAGEHGGHEGGGRHHDGPHGDHKGTKGNPKDDAMQEELAQVFDEALNAKLNSTGFCRSGFTQTDTQSRRGAKLVKGECHEPANDADREKFPNPAPKRIKVDVLE